jgi:hypothetical protein
MLKQASSTVFFCCEALHMIDIRSEQLKTFAEASKGLPGRPHPSTFWRWHRRGVRGIRLEAVVIGGRRYTSVEAIQRFVQRLNDSKSGPGSPAADTRGHLAEVERVERELDAAGI